MPTVEWLPITWEAVATLITGVAAVSGATLIGRKQTKISEIQSKIQKSQVDNDRMLRSNNLKLDLLERRSAIISDLRDVHWAFNANAELSVEERRAFSDAIQRAELIFQANLIDGLRDISHKAYKLGFINRRANHAYNRGDTAKGDGYLEEASELEHEVFNRLPELIHSMIDHSRLHDVS